MGVWEFVLIYLGVFMLLQFIAYRYFRGNNDRSRGNWTNMPNAESGPINDQGNVGYPAAHRSAGSDFSDTDDRLLETDHGRRCPTCGAGNESDPSYTFCWNCVSPLRG